ncbi:MAG: 3-hydroxyacyl-CoA dehydrogenase / enoyl-CoA hydratase / 3-hydroxybutyryl-CoA epimerase [Acidobacteriota bacterium]|jgi:3-hydroxyacyl-CoA dehydrogenase/enoyl-CoA hydratase/3-hydroxybutyryl-CoA epimerase|nr:3-hydroxyacyl-CoA dehydrogenase / enoyl-CoA hydratase / 3-hydroxybutyryl-CoA epimerase [Acidobacteriota bacterium]
MAAEAQQHEPAPGSLSYAEGIAWLVLDDPGKKVNTLSSRLFAWFGERVAELERERPKGLVVLSGKPDGFVAGADIEELLAAQSKDEVLALLARGHDLLLRFEKLPFPTVAAIHGACLGGGLELALACRFRAATENPKTKLGLPEVQLGLIPGLGGTQRLPRLIGVPDALDLILTGKQLDARRAKKLSLVDATCHPTDLRQAALRLLALKGPARKGIEKQRAEGKTFASRTGDLLAKTPLVAGKLVWDKAKAGVLAKTGGHYPAPLVAIDIVREGLGLPLRRALDLEAGAFSELVVSETAKNLMAVFFMKNEVEARAARLAKGAHELGTVAVLGAGFMGAGIAQVLAERGVPVILKDKDLPSVARGMKMAAQRFGELQKRRRMKEPDVKLAMARLHGTDAYEGFGRVDLAIEAVFEDLEIKRQVIRETEAAASGRLVFASNTSTIPIARLAEASRAPESVVGMHFFSPVAKMPLLEVIRHPGTSATALATAVAAGRKMGKTVIVVNDGPGFFTTRVLAPFLNEATHILMDGARIEQVDAAMTRWGWPVGPFALMDEVGLDIGQHVSAIMAESFGERVEPSPVIARLIADGRLGRKAGRGFYLYGDDPKEGKKVDPEVYARLGWKEAKPGSIPDREIVERCVFQMLNETARCIAEGIITDPADVDIGVIFGFGFPPFRGGLLREADRLGLGTVVERLDAYAARYGKRLEPAPLLREMARKAEVFYPRG